MRSGSVTSCVLAVALSPAAAGCGGGDNSPTEPTPICSIGITPPAATFSSQGGNGNVTVTAPAGCAWSATGGPAWATVTAWSGSGPGTVAYSVASNPAAEPRSGTLAIGGQTHTISQDARAATICTYEVSPANAEFGKDEAFGALTVTAPADCGWTAVSHAPWLGIASGQQGSGTGSVSYSVARNTDPGARTGTMTVAGRTFNVWQSGDVGACEYFVATAGVWACMPGITLTARITTHSNCPWTASSDSAWLSVTGGASGTGPGVVTIAFGDNYDAPRAGIVMVRWPTVTAGQNIHVAQAGCHYAVSRADISLPSAGGSGTFDVIQQSDPLTCGGPTQDRCIWTARSEVSWVVVTSSMPRSGDNPVAFTVSANDSASPRVGRITVRDKVVVITQAGR